MAAPRFAMMERFQKAKVESEILIPIKAYEPEQVPLGGKLETTAQLSADEVEAFNADFITMLRLVKQFDYAQDLMRLLRQNVDLIFDVMRVEKVKVSQAFDGKLGNGNGLMMDLFTPMQFGEVAFPKYTWAQATVQGVMNNWIRDPNPAGNFYQLDRYAALVILGEYLPAGVSGVIGGINVYKDGNILGGWTKDTDAYPISEYTEPLIALGEQQIRIDHFPVLTGVDYSKPWGVGIFQANRVRPITTRSPLLFL